jgi:peptidoglycan/xylan/chitin deacetylase (PgdA/CDA1 family)
MFLSAPRDFQYVIAIIVIGVMLIGVSGLIPDLALSKSSHKNKSFSTAPSKTGSPSNTGLGINNVGTSSEKVVMIGFDDSYKSQVLYAKPILDQYGFKASFFEVCTWIGKTSDRQTWQDVAALQRDGMDIESHTMIHAHLPDLLSSPSS